MRQTMLTRRGFLHAGTSAALGWTVPQLLAQNSSNRGGDISCIMLVLVGGPSQIDTWDPKPDAPAEIRGPFLPISTTVPGTHFSELFPNMAQIAHKISLVRSLTHPEAVTHETALQMIQTGRAFSPGLEHPHIGSVAAYLNGGPAHVLLPGPIRSTGADLPHGQSSGFLGAEFAPIMPAASVVSDGDDRYGPSRFGQNCRQARQLIEQGVRFVTVNMFDTIFDIPTWDMHGPRPFSDFQHLARDVAPAFDRAFAALTEDLEARGLLSTTMVVAMGEFGRTPRINPHGGRDHHAGAWTIILGGGPIQGGQVIGATDDIGFAPRLRPVSAAEVIATIYHGMGISLDQRIAAPTGQAFAVVEDGARPIWELF